MSLTYVNVIKVTPQGERKMRFNNIIWDDIRKAKQPEGTYFKLAGDDEAASHTAQEPQKLSEEQVRDFNKEKLAGKLNVDPQDYKYDELVDMYMKDQDGNG